MEVMTSTDRKGRPCQVASRTYFSDGTFKEENALLQREQLLHVYVNGILTMKIGCSDGLLAELVVGRLLTEGMVDSPDDIARLSICDLSMRAEVQLKDREADFAKGSSVQTVPTCCTMNRKLNDYFDMCRPLRRIPSIAWEPELIFDATADFENDTPGHRATRGVHSCRLFGEDGRRIACCEDIGRHNAFDKAIGSALLQGVDLGGCLAFTSGRVPTDMAVKAIRAGIPILVTKKAVTDQALDLAREYGLTLIAKANARSFSVMNDPNNDCPVAAGGGYALVSA